MSEQFMGSIIFTQQVKSRDVEAIKAAAEKAGIDPELIRELNTKFIFIRAMNELKKADVVQGTDGAMKDRLVDAENVVAFQFSRRFVEAQGAHYDPSAVVSFNKSTSEIYCKDAEVKKLAEKFFVAKATEWQPSDINRLINGVLESESKRIMLRHGVYFVGYQAHEKAAQIQKFLEALDIQFWVLPVGVNDTAKAESLHKAIVEDMIKEVTTLTEQVASMKAEGMVDEKQGLTSRKARTRMKELLKHLDGYRELAKATQADMDDLLKAAGDAGQTLACAALGVDGLIAMAQSGRRVPALLTDLLAADDQVDPSAIVKLRAKTLMPDLPVATEAAEPEEIQPRRRLASIEIDA